jgi:oligosaccharyl transferase (archaeosortase A-associated)
MSMNDAVSLSCSLSTTSPRKMGSPPIDGRWRVALAAGGTAGHVYPAIAVAEELRRSLPDVDVLFIGGRAGRESEIVSAAGFPFAVVPGEPYYGVDWVGRLRSAMALATGVLASRRLLRAKRIDAVIGFGGYAAAGPLLAARSLGLRTALVEGNAVPGKANRFLGRFVDRIYLGLRSAWPDPHDPRLARVGMPIRRAIVAAAGPRSAPKRQTARVLVLGDAFLFARTPALLARVVSPDLTLTITHQDKALAPVYPERIPARYVAQIDDMGAAYAESDLVICRAGAGTMAEIAVHGVPALVVPLSTAAEDHQTLNARALTDGGATLVVSEGEWREEVLAPQIQAMLRDRGAWRRMSEKARESAAPEAAARVAADIASAHSTHTATSWRWATTAWLALIALAAFALRVAPAWSNVFHDGRVVLASNDPWILARETDVIVRHFPHLSFFDPYRLFPNGQVNEAPLFPLMMATAAWLLGRGAPSPVLIDHVIAFMPAVLGAFVVLPVYALGRRLFGRTAGLLAAAICAVLPGQLLQRSVLGFADHHVAEALFSLSALAVFGSALGAEDPRTAHRRAWWAGMLLGAYLLTWARGVLLVAAFLAWAVLQIVWDHGRAGRRTRTEPLTFRMLLPALILVLPVQRHVHSMMMDVPMLLAGLLALPAAARLSRTLETRGWGRAQLAVSLAVAGTVAAVVAAIVLPSLRGEVTANLARFQPATGATLIGETRPLLFSDGRFSLAPAWRELTTIAILGPLGLGLLLVRLRRHAHAVDLLVAVWTLAVLAATLGQIRFAYYLAPMMAILGAGFTIRVLMRSITPVFATIAALALAVYPSLAPAWANAERSEGPSSAWLETLDWLGRNTPEPFSDPDAYFAGHDLPRDDRFIYPLSAYGVLAWSDYGYWITRIARRIPVTNPTQHGATEVASYLTATDPMEAARQLQALGAGYLILDASLLPIPAEGHVTRLGLLESLIGWGQRDASQLYQVLYTRGPDQKLHANVVYLPAYYRMMATRLYVFNGAAVVPHASSWVVETAPAQTNTKLVEEMVSARRFDTYDEAASFMAMHPGPRFRLVGRDPYASCVPLPALPAYSRIHESPFGRAIGAGRKLADIVVFEFDAGGRN